MPKSLKAPAASLLALALSACAITQTGTPVALSADNPSEICVIEHPDVFGAFLPAMRESLVARGFSVKLLPRHSATSTCPLTATYVALRSWDLETYMSQARIRVYQAGESAGEAIYDAPKGGWAMTTRIHESTESKVDTMIAQLFPSRQRRTPLPKQP